MPKETPAERARRRGSPIVDDTGATFVWLDDGPAPVVVGDWCGWEAAAGLDALPAMFPPAGA